MTILAMLARYFLEFACSKAEPGMSTDELDQIAHTEMISKGVYPSPLNYSGFPKSICTSINHVACHGIPSKKDILKVGDVLSIDVSIYYKGYHGDNCKTIIVGPGGGVSSHPLYPEASRLIEVNEQALNSGIQACLSGRPVTAIGEAIQVLSLSFFDSS